uniref:F-actin-capping protein subunit alpha n=1 Tax=Anisakis simplex TaxID=6269 RepID=A0A0M3JL69_ANISI
LRKGQSPSPSNISEMSEFVAAQDVFDETTLSKLKDEIDRTEVFIDSEVCTRLYDHSINLDLQRSI